MDRLVLGLQREIGRLLSPIWIPAISLGLARFFRYRVEGIEEVRAEYRKICSERTGPILICANHLTMIDSVIIAWALGSVGWYLRNFSTVPWNVPERTKFTTSILSTALVSTMKCLPVIRGGDRRQVSAVLNRFSYLLERGEIGMVFPEGGRSRTGRVEVENAAHGVGRVVGALPGCRVLCVYLRGDHQETYTDLPVKGERFDIRLDWIEPESRFTGLRKSLDLSRQIVRHLAEMERCYFDGRQ